MPRRARRLGLEPDPTPPKQPLSTQRIVSAALEQMRDKGYEGVSMRSVARALDTGPASLYVHVSNRDDLDQLVLDQVMRLVDLPEPDAERWQEQVRHVARGMLAVYRAHPGTARAALALVPVYEGGLRTTEGLLAILLQGGVPARPAAWFCDLLGLYVAAVAYEEVLWEQREDGEGEESVVRRVADAFDQLPAGRYPVLAANVAAMAAGEGDDRFEFGLDVLLGGLVTAGARHAAG